MKLNISGQGIMFTIGSVEPPTVSKISSKVFWSIIGFNGGGIPNLGAVIVSIISTGFGNIWPPGVVRMGIQGFVQLPLDESACNGGYASHILYFSTHSAICMSICC